MRYDGARLRHQQALKGGFHAVGRDRHAAASGSMVTIF
jgi:hypothetical protein